MKIYQLYYSDSCLPHLQEGFIHRKNINPDPNSLYRENLDIIDIYYNEDWRKEDYIGLVSWRFFEKTGLTYSDIEKQITGSPCYILSPKKMNTFGHSLSNKAPKSTIEICDYIDSKEILPYKLKHHPVETNAFCNYFVMTPEMFESYAKYILKFINQFEYDRNSYGFREVNYKLPQGGQCSNICIFMEGLLAVWLVENKVQWKYVQDPVGKESTLTELAIKYKTDKWGDHHYTGHYDKLFRSMRNKSITLMEIGIGGDADPHKGGESLSMWLDYFPNGTIYGVDIHHKWYRRERCHITQCSQTDHVKMDAIAQEYDIIIDDGSHVNSHVISTFEFMFNRLKPDGIYIVEDCQTSYFEFEGLEGKDDPQADTMMNYFKTLCDGINHAERQNYKPTDRDTHISEIRFLHNLIIIIKGDNIEPSNRIKK